MYTEYINAILPHKKQGGAIMAKQISLPRKNKDGFFEIRLESIGGLGANISGKMIAECGVMQLGLNGINFSSYGSEKKGTPVKAFVRFADANKEIRIRSGVDEPNVLAVFHENLVNIEPILQGLDPEGVLIVNTHKSPAEIRDEWKVNVKNIYTVDAIRLALEHKTRINVVMIGALARATGFIEKEAMAEVIRATFEKKYPATVPSNLAGFEAGYEDIQVETFETGKYESTPAARALRDIGYASQPIGGMIPTPGNSIAKDLATSREGKIPVFLEEKCINCGLCETTCPDYCYNFVEEEKDGKLLMVNKGVDYTHCKGCLRCVEVCPTNALIEKLEREYDVAKAHFGNPHANQDVLPKVHQF